MIIGQFFGHHHTDTFRMFYSNGSPVSWKNGAASKINALDIFNHKHELNQKRIKDFSHGESYGIRMLFNPQNRSVISFNEQKFSAAAPYFLQILLHMFLT